MVRERRGARVAAKARSENIPQCLSCASKQMVAQDAETALVRWCASRCRIDKPEHARTLIRSGVEWTRVLSIARWHGVVPLLHTAIVNSGLAEIPHQAASAIRAEFLRQTADSLLYARELVRVMAALEENKVRAVAFKGPALAKRLYNKASLRQCRDLDLLVAQNDLPKALNILHSHGYERCTDHGADDASLFRTEKDYLVVNAASLFKVELHWAIAEPSFYIRTPFDAIWSRRESVSVLGAAIPVPHTDDLLLLLCIHGARHCWASLKWICDIDELVRQCPNIAWRQLCERASDLGCRRMLLIGLRLAKDVLGTALPAAIEQEIDRDPAVEAVSANLHAKLLSNSGVWFDHERIICYVRSHERWYDRARMVTSYMVGNLRPNERDREFIRLPTSLSLAYWPIRIIRVVYRHWRDAGKPLLASVICRNQHRPHLFHFFRIMSRA